MQKKSQFTHLMWVFGLYFVQVLKDSYFVSQDAKKRYTVHTVHCIKLRQILNKVTGTLIISQLPFLTS